MPSFTQSFQRPQIAAADGEARRPVTAHRDATDVFQQAFGTGNVVVKLFVTEVGCTLVAITVAGKFMAVIDNGAHHLRVALGDPAQREKGRVGVVRGQQREDALDVALDTARLAVPAVARDVRRERRHLEIIFNVDGHGVTHCVFLMQQRNYARPAIAAGWRQCAPLHVHPNIRGCARLCRRR